MELTEEEKIRIEKGEITEEQIFNERYQKQQKEEQMPIGAQQRLESLHQESLTIGILFGQTVRMNQIEIYHFMMDIKANYSPFVYNCIYDLMVNDINKLCHFTHPNFKPDSSGLVTKDGKPIAKA